MLSSSSSSTSAGNLSLEVSMIGSAGLTMSLMFWCDESSLHTSNTKVSVFFDGEPRYVFIIAVRAVSWTCVDSESNDWYSDVRISAELAIEVLYSPRIQKIDPRESESVNKSTFATNASIKCEEASRSASMSTDRSATAGILMARFPIARMLLRTIWSSISKAYSSSSCSTTSIFLSLASKKISSSFVSLMYTGSSNWQKNIETERLSISALSSSNRITFRMVRNWISAGLDMRFEMHPETRLGITGRTSTKLRIGELIGGAADSCGDTISKESCLESAKSTKSSIGSSKLSSKFSYSSSLPLLYTMPSLNVSMSDPEPCQPVESLKSVSLSSILRFPESIERVELTLLWSPDLPKEADLECGGDLLASLFLAEISDEFEILRTTPIEEDRLRVPLCAEVSTSPEMTFSSNPSLM
ncbi:hypothetical protein OGAPHI_006526 [Ogataea philodendri]|uniref:Uncharacterized protein n=1 Tax=Ogataea philodendri TaxID=1378263 RepID=A0A9P8NYP8_9ASCO|nr:uncharacterized protein OGAPHI_006526 [Ogataea philodendri]KAH3661676.1 hypothetical protein OGAPHI_006526 [Ogataea philodendri]